MNKLLSILGLTLAACAAHAERAFLVQSSIHVAGEQRAAPGMAIADRHMGRVTIGENLDLAIVPTGISDSQVLVSSLLLVDGESHQPAVLLKLGQRGSVEIGDKRISFLVTKFPKSDES